MECFDSVRLSPDDLVSGAAFLHYLRSRQVVGPRKITHERGHVHTSVIGIHEKHCGFRTSLSVARSYMLPHRPFEESRTVQ